jgi:hypothetical protein
MDNSENLQPEPSQVIELEPESIDHRSQPENFFAKYYWVALLIVLLGICAGIGGYGYYKLSFVGNVEQDEIENVSQNPESALTSEAPEPITAPSHQDTLSSPWIAVAIALACMTGCLITFRLLNRPKAKKQ